MAVQYPDVVAGAFPPFHSESGLEDAAAEAVARGVRKDASEIGVIE